MLRNANAALREEVQANRLALNQQAAAAAAHVDGEMDVDGAGPLPPVFQPRTRNLMKLRTFVGDQNGPEPWIVWRNHGEKTINVNCWDLATVKDLVSGSMSRIAGIYATELEEKVNACESVLAVLDVYEEVVLSKGQRDNLKTYLHNLRQEEGESPQYLAIRLRTLYKRVWPTKT